MGVTAKKFGNLTSGEEITLYHLENKSGACAEVMDYGAILVKLCVPDKDGELTDVVLGYDDVQQYEVNGCFFGAIIGRSGNRIAGARFSLYGQEYQLDKNENDNNLHSGPNGFEKKIWTVKNTDSDKNAITFSRISPDGENGFPGEFQVSVTYEFTEDNTLQIYYSGISDKATLANMTNHSYFNLSGEGSGNVLDQEVCIHAKYFTPVKDSQSIPTGEYVSVEGTPMDFNVSKPIGRDIEADFEQLKLTGGYDHNYVTDNYAKGNVRAIASAYCKESGIGMEVSSDCPCVQFYAGNFIVDEKGKKGHVYHQRDGFCLETQVEPNAVNVEDFHSPILRPGEEYSSETIYRFFVK